MIRPMTLAAAATMTLAGATAALAFPDKPIRLVIPYPPGGASSLNGGVIATSAEPHFSQPMIPTIRAGGGGVAGAAFTLGEPADGHTILLGDVTINSLRPLVEQEVPFEVGDFAPLARFTLDPMIFVASPSAPFDTVQGMVDFARENPDDFRYSSDNVNGWTYVAFKALEAETGVAMQGIEFGGGGPAVANILGGNTMAYAGAPAVVGEHIAAGTLVALCAAGEARAPTLPDVPTCTEQGLDVVWQVWLGAFAHKDTPPERVETLRASFASLVEDEGLLRLLGRINTQLAFLDGAAFEAALESEQGRLLAIYQRTQ